MAEYRRSYLGTAQTETELKNLQDFFLNTKKLDANFIAQIKSRQDMATSNLNSYRTGA
jgi:hypothetical protein